MKSNEVRSSGASSPEKQRKTHVAICLVFLAVVFAGIIIAAVIIGLNGGFDARVNGKNAEELYSSVQQSISGNTNNEVKITRTARADSAFGQATLQVLMREEITRRISGDNFYYKKISTTTYTAGDKENSSASMIEITIVGDKVYVRHDNEKQLEQLTSLDTYLEAFDISGDMLLDIEGLFDSSDIRSADGSNTVLADLTDSKYESDIEKNAKTFFLENKQSLNWIWSFYPTFSGEKVTAVYNDDGLLTQTSYSYSLTDSSKAFLSGSAQMNANITYGNIEITAPADADEFK
ncbi:MAG: hypothetical protein IJX92_07955 [Clostridia bacterium]|nr:hypothetical protein [Clostridia bacterium]